jgi:hypothetical protein
VRVNKNGLASVLNGLAQKKFDTRGVGSVCLVSLNEEEGDQLVGISYLLPRFYEISDTIDWENFAVDGEVAILWKLDVSETVGKAQEYGSPLFFSLLVVL